MPRTKVMKATGKNTQEAREILTSLVPPEAEVMGVPDPGRLLPGPDQGKAGQVEFRTGEIKTSMEVAVVEEDIPDDAPMTAVERDDYRTYMASIKTKCIETAKMILEIRRRKLYREEFKSFDEWVACYFGSTRQWVTTLGHWVHRQELSVTLARSGGPLALPYNGKPAYQIMPKEAEHLGPLEHHPEEFCRALVEATEICRQNPKRKRTKTLEETVKTQEDYLRRKNSVPDLTYEEFQAVNSVGWNGRISDELVSEVTAIKSQGGDWMGRLVEAVKESDLYGDVLIGCARGQELIDLCAKLKVQKDEREALREAEQEAKQATAKLERTRAEIGKRQEATAMNPEEAERTPSEVVETQEGPVDDRDEEDDLPMFKVDLTGSFVGIPEELYDSIWQLMEGWKANVWAWNLDLDSAIIIKPVRNGPTRKWAEGKMVSAKELLNAALTMIQEVKTSLQNTSDSLEQDEGFNAVFGAAYECEAKLGEIMAMMKDDLVADTQETVAGTSGKD